MANGAQISGREFSDFKQTLSSDVWPKVSRSVVASAQSFLDDSCILGYWQFSSDDIFPCLVNRRLVFLDYELVRFLQLS